MPWSPLLSKIKWHTGERVLSAPEPPSMEEGWKAFGNRYFQGRYFKSAAVAYSTGLAQTPYSHTLRLNRALTYLRLGYSGAALSYCNNALAQTTLPSGLRAKALHRKAQALYGLGRWDEAEIAFAAVEKELPSEVATYQQWIKKCHKRRQESEAGTYDWSEMYIASQSSPRLDVADYRGDIEVTPLDPLGEGGYNRAEGYRCWSASCE
ncbi:hypothetical protein FRB90_001734 [Tulasnella sp. 427]|nr:hypothetical protein FRB90_001734 [Tulasnella sp. 427]